MAKYIDGEWVVGYEPPEKPKVKIDDELIILGQHVKVSKITPIHSVSGPVGCLLWRDKELTDDWFHFCGYHIHFDKEIYLHTRGGKKETCINQGQLFDHIFLKDWYFKHKLDIPYIEQETVNVKDFFYLD